MPPKKIKLLLPGQQTLPFMKKSANNNNDSSISVAPDSEPSVVENADTADVSAQPDNDTPNPVSDKPQLPDTRKVQDRWLKIWPWLYFSDNKMFCKLCIKYGKKNIFTTGCTTFKTSSMQRHQEIDEHKSCIEVPVLQSNMTEAVNIVNSEEDKAVMNAMKVVYWMATENIALSKYESFINLLKELECPGIDFLKVNDRVQYQSYYSANQMLASISEVIDKEVDEKLLKSPCVSIFSDESTDISNTKRITLTARIIDPEKAIPSTVFLRDIDYEDGSGEGLAEVIISEASKRSIPFRKITGFGSDGASVMTGLDKGVRGRLKELNPHMMHVHCMAHRLALCTSQAANGIPALKKYQEWMTSLFYYFKHSPTKEQQLHKVQNLLDHPVLKYKEIHAVRWLSFYEALETVYRTIDPLMSYMTSRNASKDPKAKGLLKKMATNEFIFVTYLMMDVMAMVSKLCLVFQKEDLDVVSAKVNCNHYTEHKLCYLNFL